MRNLLLALCTALALAIFSPSALHTASIEPPQIETEEGVSPPFQEPSALTTFDLALSVQGATDLAGFEFDILYNRAAAQISGITPRPFFGQPAQCSAAAQRCAAGLGPVHKNDRSRVGGYSYGATAGANGSGLLAVIHVQTSANPDSLTFTIANPLVVDSQGNPITQNVTLQLSRASGGQIFLPLIDR